MDKKRTDILFEKCLSGTASGEERREFLLLLIADEAMAQQYIHRSFVAEGEEKVSSEQNTALIFESIVNADKSDSQHPIGPVHRVHFLKRTWFRYAAAVLLVLGVAYLWNRSMKTDNALVNQTKPAPAKIEVSAGSDRAVLTLSDGRTVELNGAGGAIKDGERTIKNINGQLIYTDDGITGINTMKTPKGGQYQLTLSDGTRVWLNAASSITYPTNFTNTVREVSITGEIYFEVTKNPSKPFVVKTLSNEIVVLGTSFNINAYADEPAIKTSLVDGSIKIDTTILQPGQAYVNGKKVTTDIQQDIAWRNGKFSFRRADLQTIMRQLARWYDVDVEFKGVVSNDTFTGDISRSLTLTQVMNLITDTNIKYVIQDKKITILSEK